MKKQQSGFTMIELIMVIVNRGSLAAFALPRFADFGTDARAAAIQGGGAAVLDGQRGGPLRRTSSATSIGQVGLRA